MLIPFDQLFARHGIKSKGCCHLGANDGGERDAYHKLGIERCIWIEAVPAVFKKLISNITGYPGNIALCACLSDRDIELGTGWFLNVDLQGAELLALKGMGDLLKHFDHAYIEVNERELYKGCPLVGEIDAFMAKAGFVRKETVMTKHFWGDALYQRV